MASPQAEDTLVLVRRKPGYRWRRLLFTCLTVVVSAVAGFTVGHWGEIERYQMFSQGLGALSGEVGSLKAENARLQRELIAAERALNLDQRAALDAQRKIRELQEELRQHHSKITFYRTIMAPENLETGLQVLDFTLHPTWNDSLWDLSFALAQLGDNSRFLSGTATVSVRGTVDGEPATLGLADLTGNSDHEEITFRFRYFQSIDAQLSLPDGFEPAEVIIDAQREGRGEDPVTRSFRWQSVIQEEQVHAG